MSFWRHEEIYRSDVGLGEARNGNGCRRSPHSSAAMSFQSAIPRQGALQQSLPPLHRLETILNNQCCRTMILQRTATTPLIACLSPRVHSKEAPPSGRTGSASRRNSCVYRRFPEPDLHDRHSRSCDSQDRNFLRATFSGGVRNCGGNTIAGRICSLERALP